MGVFRFLLAALVVLFHFGGLSWIVGRIAVYAFYCISGFLIFQVLDRVYLPESAGGVRFLANRFIRLAPLYIAYALITAVLLGVVSRSTVLGVGIDVPDEPRRELVQRTMTVAPTLEHRGALPILAFDPPLLPQGWSIGVEATLYLLAPLVVLATRRRAAWLVVWVAAALAVTLQAFVVAGVDFDQFQVEVYKNAIASLSVFLIGGGCYYVRRRWGAVVSPWIAWPAVAIWLALITMPQLSGGTFPLPSAQVFAEHLWLTLVVTWLVLLSPPLPWRSLDRFAGNVTYGVYLNHFIAALLIASSGAWRDVASVGTVAAGLCVLAAASVLATVTYLVIERPFDAVRSRVRRVETPSASPVIGRSLVAVPIAAVLVASAGVPVGWGVARLNGAANGVVLPVSGPFHIRWAATVSDATRRRIEGTFGLIVDGPVTRDPRHRTYEYRLPHPTRDRVRALITDPAVEDTARIDVKRYEIAE
jgi:peptidoglycan/LPS O-acetylase OafA/YrhL